MEVSPQWGLIVGRLTELLGTLKDNHVAPFLVRKLLTQVAGFVNVQLFNRWGAHPATLTPKPTPCFPALLPLLVRE